MRPGRGRLGRALRTALCAPALLAFALALATLWAPARAGAGSVCAPDRVDIRTARGVVRLRVELATTPEARARGLMFRSRLPERQGMLFVFERPGAPRFWMKNTLIPLDMIFVDARGVVRHVHARARPGDLTPVSGGKGILAVLEIGGGLAARWGIAPGAELRHPAFGAAAAWPCPQAGG